MRLKRKEKGDERRRMNIFGEVSKCKERRLTTPGSEAKRPKGCTSGTRKHGETSCGRAGAEP
jgi:hypothetical protein